MRTNSFLSVFRLASVLALALTAADCVTHASDSATSRTTTGRPAVAVTVSQASRAPLAEGIDVVGSLAPKFSADVKSEITGVVSDVYVADWIRVKKGEPLARLDSSEIDAGLDALKAALAQTEVLENRARREHQRALELEASGLITSQALDETRTALQAGEAATAAARAQIRVGIVEQAQRLVFLAEKGFEFGVTTHLEVQDAQLNLLGAYTNLLRAERDYRVARVNLEWVMGTLEQ